MIPPTLALGFDASTPRCAIALGRVGGDAPAELVAEDDEYDKANQASARLAGRLEAVLQDGGVGPQQLGVVGCGRGPGTFTGVRVALATAKGVASGLGLCVVPFSSLEALAWTAQTTGIVVPLFDARRGEVYGATLALEATNARPLSQERVAPVTDIVADAQAVAGDAPIVAIGSGAITYADALPAHWRIVRDVQGPSPQAVLSAMAVEIHRGGAVRPEDAHATYLRKSYAELGINKPKRPFAKSPFV